MTDGTRKNWREAELHPLFVLALAGDRQAYDRLLHQIASISRNYVRRKLGDTNDSDDVTQEILISVHRALHTYDAARPCMPWLAAIMHYRLTDWLRKHYRATAIKNIAVSEIEAILSNDVTETSSPDEYLTQAVSELSQRQQAVIQAMYHQELSVRETSEKLGMSISAVKVTAHRAYRKLQNMLENK